MAGGFGAIEDVLTQENRRGMTPLFWSHVLPYAEVKLNMNSRLAGSTNELWCR